MSTGTAGSNAAASITNQGDNNFLLNMTIPRGNDGTSGITPVFSNSVSTSTLSADSSATASISGSGTSSNSYKFSFGIPRGNTGSQGPTGPSAINAVNLTTNGYIKFTNGFTIQWAKTSDNSTKTLIFPITFTTSAFGIFRTAYDTTSSFTTTTTLSFNNICKRFSIVQDTLSTSSADLSTAQNNKGDIFLYWENNKYFYRQAEYKVKK